MRKSLKTLNTILLTALAGLSACMVPASSPGPVYSQPQPQYGTQPPPPPPPQQPQYGGQQPQPQPPPPTQPIGPAPVVVVAPPPRPPVAPMPPPAAWDSRGWTLLGESTVDGNRDRDKIKIGNAAGRFSKMTFVVLDSDLEMDDLAINFVGGGKQFRPTTRAFFRENTRTHVIDLPGEDRALGSVQFRYRNLPGGGRARVQVWGFLVGGPAPVVVQPVPMPTPVPQPVPQPAPGWNSNGWTLLGERVVNGNGKRDNDRIAVGKDDGVFRRLTVVVLDSDLEMVSMEIKLGRGKPLNFDVRQMFRENTRTRVLDLPGDTRVIKWIDFRYRNLPGGGNARVQVWAQ